MTVKPWFEQWPERLDQELEALRHAQIEFVQDGIARKAGTLKLHLTTPRTHPAGIQRLTAIFPDEYPFFRPLVFAPELTLPRHQNPFQRNLCLLERVTIAWDSRSTLAEHLQEQLKETIERGQVTDPELLSTLGEQAEPVSDFYLYEPGAAVLVDPDNQTPLAEKRGTLQLGHHGQGRALVGAVFQVSNEHGLVLSNPRPVPDRFQKKDRIRWVRSDVQPPHQNADDLEAWLQEANPWALSTASRMAWGGGFISVAAVLYQEEVEPGRTGDAWLFLVREMSGSFRVRKRYLARTFNFSEREMFTRIPDLAFLRGASVALAGVGCVGAPLALELARAGVGTLRLLDGDVVEAGATVRWPLGLEVVGEKKVQALGKRIYTSYPFTEVVPISMQLGRIYDPADGPLAREYPAPRDVIEHWLDGADAIVDTTAEWGVHFYLSEGARWRDIPYISISGSAGGWGGSFFRVVPGSELACWRCLEHWIEDDRSNATDRVPLPSESPEGVRSVQPRGCADPTFTGAGFDVGQIALSGARFTVMTLSSRLNGGYPDTDWNYASVSLRDTHGEAIAPSWRTAALETHPSCKCQQ